MAYLPPSLRKLNSLMIFVVLGGFLASVFVLTRYYIPEESFRAAIAWSSALATLLSGVLIGWLNRRRYITLEKFQWRERIVLRIAFLLFFSCIATPPLLILTIYINCALDASPSIPYVVNVVSKHQEKLVKGGTIQNAVIEDWNTPGKTRRIRLTKSDYEHLEPGNTRLVVCVRRGRLGWKWYADVHIAKQVRPPPASSPE
ncbi:hypothetical protein HYR69_06095 [Candidatus Sumerlaeota bacterium]|nr:hypothetical protein [Candidatus Sumerlaeota bacterium]